MSINCVAIKSLCLEITYEKSKDMIEELTYKQLNGDAEEFGKHINKIL